MTIGEYYINHSRPKMPSLTYLDTLPQAQGRSNFVQTRSDIWVVRIESRGDPMRRSRFLVHSLVILIPTTLYTHTTRRLPYSTFRLE